MRDILRRCLAWFSSTSVVVTPEYFPRRTLYGTYAKRAELTGGVLPRANLVGTQSRRVNLTGGEG